jgi:ATP-dependent Clp protease ATP-binding subunit ClpA
MIFVRPIHLLLMLVHQQDGIVRVIITKVSIGTQAFQKELSNELDNMPEPSMNGNPLNTTRRRNVTLLRLYDNILKIG